MSSPESDRSFTEQFSTEQLVVEARTHRRTALVALRGELDIVTVTKVAEVLDGLEPQAAGVRHIVLESVGHEPGGRRRMRAWSGDPVGRAGRFKGHRVVYGRAAAAAAGGVR